MSEEPFVQLSVRVIQGKEVLFDSQIQIPSKKVTHSMAEKMAAQWLVMMQSALDLIKAGHEEQADLAEEGA